jgi:hypothetical protein
MIIRHKRFLDVCFEVQYTLLGKLRGKWINMGYVKSWYLPTPPQVISINAIEWEQCTTPGVKCLRYGTWVQL